MNTEIFMKKKSYYMKSKNIIILEFNGLPGVGKSTICKELKELLDKEHINTVDGYYGRLWNRYAHTVLFSKKYVHMIKCLAKCRGSYYDMVKNHVHAVNFVTSYRTYQDFMKNSDKQQVLIVEQGFVQHAISLFYDKHIPSESTLFPIWEMVKDAGNSLVSINCDNDINTVMNRLRKRPSNASRLDKLEEDEMKKTLMIQVENFAKARKGRSKIFGGTELTLDTNNTPSFNAEQIMKIIRKRLFAS